MDEIVNLCKRRGFVFPSAEIYGGFRSTYDYGPLGVLMLRNVKDAWWRAMVQLRDDVVGLDAAILSSPKIWEASGHLANFTDPLVDCRNCKERWRADHLEPDPTTARSTAPTAARPTSPRPGLQPDVQDLRRPGGGRGQRRLPAARDGPGHFVNFVNVLQTSRKRPPFGIAQIGKSFRNEITPGNFVFRTREFEQMELEYFVPPAEADQWFEYWCQRAARVVRRPRHPRGDAAAAAPRPRGAVALFGGHVRRGVPVPVGLGRARGHRQPDRLRPEGPRRGQRREAGVLRPGHRRALRALRDRAGGRAPPGR